MKNQERILIIDDEPDFVEAFQRTMESRRYNVMTTSSRSSGQEMVKAQPDVIVLGTLAPAGQSFAMHQWLKQDPRYKNIPLLVIDARFEERSVRGWRQFEGKQLLAEDYVSKPIEPASLVPRIQRLLQEIITKIKVLVVDDHTMVRNGICAVLSLQEDVQLVGEAADGQDALDKVLRFAPNVALMDIVMPVMSGLEATRQISREYPHTRVLILTQYDEEENMLVARKAGAYGFIPKRAASSELITGIKTVNAGEYFPASFARISSN